MESQGNRRAAAISFVDQEPLRPQLDREGDGLGLAIVEEIQELDMAERAHLKPWRRILGDEPESGRRMGVHHFA